jgi:hypothetical protein
MFVTLWGEKSMFGFLDRLANLWGIARDARKDNAPREWILVDAYSAFQARPGVRLTHGEALQWVRDNLRAAPIVQTDFDNSIIFFDGRKPER